MSKSTDDKADKLLWSYSEKWGFTILGVGVLLLFGLIGYWILGSKPMPESHHVQVYVAVDTLNSGVIDLYTRAEVDTLIDCLQNHEALLDKKYQYILDQKEEEDRFKTYLAIIVSIIVSIAAFFGFKTISDLKKQCREESETLSSTIAEKKAIEVAEKKAEQKAQSVAEKKAIEVAEKKAEQKAQSVAEKKANTVAGAKAQETAKKVAQETAKRIAGAKARTVAEAISNIKSKEVAEQYLKDNFDTLVDTSVTQYLESNLQKLVNDKIEDLYNGTGRQSIIEELETVFIENINKYLTKDPGKAFIDSAIQEAIDTSLGERADAVIEEKLDKLRLIQDASVADLEEDTEDKDEDEDDSNPGGMF